jgi:hypothetical protein
MARGVVCEPRFEMENSYGCREVTYQESQEAIEEPRRRERSRGFEEGASGEGRGDRSHFASTWGVVHLLELRQHQLGPGRLGVFYLLE